jgi:hypothetical protein
MSDNLQKEEALLDQEIASELIELTPEWWTSIILDIEYSFEFGMEKYTHVISSSEGHKDIIEPSDKLFDATDRLGKLFQRHGKRWRRATYNLQLANDGNWKYIVTFGY